MLFTEHLALWYILIVDVLNNTNEQSSHSPTDQDPRAAMTLHCNPYYFGTPTYALASIHSATLPKPFGFSN